MAPAPQAPTWRQVLLGKTLLLCRIAAAIFLIGFFQGWLSWVLAQQMPRAWQLHADLIAAQSRIAITLAGTWLLFPAALRRALRLTPEVRRAMGLGVVLALSLPLAQVIGALFSDYLKWQWHGLNAVQLTYVLGIALSAAVVEEVCFRFVLLDRGAALIGMLPAFALQVLLFVAIHIGPDTPADRARLINVALAACVFGILYLWTRSLLATMTAHFIFDVVIPLPFGSGTYGVNLYPALVTDNFGRAYGLFAADVVMLAWMAFMLQRWKGPTLGAWARRRYA